jgi:hypothetical protein
VRPDGVLIAARADGFARRPMVGAAGRRAARPQAARLTASPGDIGRTRALPMEGSIALDLATALDASGGPDPRPARARPLLTSAAGWVGQTCPVHHWLARSTCRRPTLPSSPPRWLAQARRLVSREHRSRNRGRRAGRLLPERHDRRASTGGGTLDASELRMSRSAPQRCTRAPPSRAPRRDWTRSTDYSARTRHTDACG